VTIDPGPHATPPDESHGRRRGGSPPRFADDPLGWLAWLDSVDPADRELIRQASRPDFWRDVFASAGRGLAGKTPRPDVWRDESGRGWRVVTTDQGPEIRPTLDHQPTPKTDLPIVTCLLVTPDSLQVEVCSRRMRMIEALPRRALSLVDIGKAMFTASELPHEGLDRMDADAFRLARRRWDDAEARRRGPRSASRSQR
jgi:hypothetical protein